tara:strand:+ start:7321 stop:7617 length:297 start_codon:yes stop_codon:yes gene_type:complete
MRVNVQYSVELDEVLSELQLLYIRESNKLQSVATKSNLKLKEKYTDRNLSEIGITMEEYRQAVDNFSIKLVEMSNILNGYDSIRKDTNKDSTQQKEAK